MKNILRYAMIITAVSLVALTGLTTASADSADNKAASVTILGGAQSLTNTAAVDLKDSLGNDPAWNEDAQVVTGSIEDLQVVDHRGNAAGWYITLQSTNFQGSAEVASESIDASAITVAVDDLVRISGQGVSPSNGPITNVGVQTPLDSPVVIVEAAANHGMGTYGFDLDFELTIPQLQLSGPYQATVTFTLYSAQVPAF